MSYLRKLELTAQQLKALKDEEQPFDLGWGELLAVLAEALREAAVVVQGIDPSRLDEPRVVGRKKLPTTVNGS